MFLKRITLHGFKSFADRTELQFSDGITGIVGPNGCGKSNVLDAVRWVLGAQSAKSLRGARMLDVIFSGSRSRKPANFAEVQLCFNNETGLLGSDRDEVTVGRTLYRNGDSEYKLNGDTCRLKDIRELLLDTGVGVDAYSVIEQGRVDRLLQASPVERREIFEEAAGVSRYRVRRAETQRKLERTQNNLLRLNDVVDELERRLRSVKLAAGKARRFQEYDARLRELRSSFALAEYHGLTDSINKSREKFEKLNADLTARRSRFTDGDTTLADKAREQQAADAEIQELAEELRAIETEMGALLERATQGRSRILEYRALSEKRRAHGDELSGAIASLNDQIEASTAEIEKLVSQVEQNSGQVEQLQQHRYEAEAKHEATRKSLDLERNAVYEIARNAALVTNQCTTIEREISRIDASKNKLAERRQTLADEKQTHEASKKEADERIAALEEAVESCRARIRTLEEERNAADEHANNTEQSLSDAKETRSGLISRLALLEDLEKRSEGINAGTQEVLAWRDEPANDGTVLGLVADVIQLEEDAIPKLRHVLALYEKHVVVRSLDAFLAEMERRGGLPGPVEIIALDRIPEKLGGADYGTVAGGIQRATEWAKSAAEHEPIANLLLGQVFAVETRAQALKRAENISAGSVFLTPDGEAVFPGGRMIVGPGNSVESLISRKAEIRQLSAKRDEADNTIGKLQRELTENQQRLDELDLQRQSVFDEISTKQQEQANCRAESARHAADAERCNRLMEDADREAESLVTSLEESAAQLTSAKHQHDEIESQLADRGAKVSDWEQKLLETERSVAEQSQQLTDALVEIGRQSEKRAAAEQALRELSNRLRSVQDEQKAAIAEAEQAEAKAVEIEKSCEEADERHSALRERCGEIQKAVEETREKRDTLRSEIAALSEEARTLQTQIQELTEKTHECDAALREYTVRQENVVTRVQEELGMDLASLYSEYAHTDQDWEATRQEINELREKIQRLGNVNLDAITELEELAPRHENMVQQREDLAQSIESLTKLITDLDNESHKRFAEAFKEIRANFQDLFRKLFGGGRADVILEDPDRPLECGIEIIARPPGKEPQSISLLSGGEKTMTCVALLMAVFKSKPSPFAVLDEVDAALDEANVERFSKLLQDFLSVSQFVVITHNKKTMASADVLYGITMEEPGVSKRVSVRFDDRVHTPNVA